MSNKKKKFSAPAIHVANQEYELMFRQVIDWWGKTYPEEVVIFDEEMKHERSQSATGRGGGMWQNKHAMMKGQIPPKVHKGIAIKLEMEEVLPPDLSKNWQRVPELCNTFFNLFKIGAMNNSQVQG